MAAADVVLVNTISFTYAVALGDVTFALEDGAVYKRPFSPELLVGAKGPETGTVEMVYVPADVTLVDLLIELEEVPM
ncbi:hypothetical protein EL26_17425 [Tumebacillus flagellatus]|uniref:Uncharacterized protein n=1 Tax=Tumebacillus flagellatus TaxID=1157490 RepID=A0A074LNM4_9BACL|nr:hypothetical protein EL26_17425 [Tumebacillus flagellatus]